MRILTITNLYPNPFQPQRATFNRQQVKQLAFAGHEVAVISPISWTDELAARRSGSPALPKNRQMEWDGVVVEYPRFLFTPRSLRGWYGQFYRWSVRGAFRRALRTLQPDLIFATWAYPDGWAAVRLAHLAGLPVVLKVHGSDLLQLDLFPSRKRGTMDALRKAGRIVVVSKDLKRKAIELGADADRVRMIYNGVDPLVFHRGSRIEARLRLGLHPNRHVLLFIGNLLPVKGIDILLNACALLRTSDFDFELHMIGRGPLQGQIEKQIQAKQLQDRVRLVGSIPNDQLPDWYRAASLFVLPSRSEGVPNVLLESAACGTPFVASNVGGIPEIAHLGSSRLFKVEDVDGLASAIRIHLTQGTAENRIETMPRTHGDAGRELVDVFQEAIDEHASRTRSSSGQRTVDGVVSRYRSNSHIEIGNR